MILILDNNFQLAAEYIPDQLLEEVIGSTCVALAGANLGGVTSKGAHAPAFSRWARESVENYDWLQLFVKYLFWEWYFRHGEQHKYRNVVVNRFFGPPADLRNNGMTPFPQIVPNSCVMPLSPVSGYRLALMEYLPSATWALRGDPCWWRRKTLQYPAVAAQVVQPRN